MAERSNAAVLKTVEVKASGGSNPSLSAKPGNTSSCRVFYFNPYRTHMSYFTYILISEKNGRRYFGSCGDLKKRLKNHNSGKVRSTKAYKPYRILYFEIFTNKPEAQARERFFKTIDGYQFLKFQGII
jgi:putative endonuclease